MDDVTIVIPSKGEDANIAKEITKGAKCAVIVVHDMYYGQAVKIGVRAAKTEYVLTMDGDGQHTVQEAETLYRAFKLVGCDLMIGDRRLVKQGGLRVLGSAFFNLVASIFSGRWVVDLNSGMRIFRRETAIKYERILCDKFSYTTTLAMAYLADGLNVEWFPICVFPRKSGRSHVNTVTDGLKTLYYIVRIGFALRTRMIRKCFRSR